MLQKLKQKAIQLKSEVIILYYAYQNRELPLLPKLLIALTIAYSLSPIDLVPDFIPVLGYLDDLILVPLLISLSIRFIPYEIMEKARLKAITSRIDLKKNWVMAIIFVFIWLFIIFMLLRALYYWFNI